MIGGGLIVGMFLSFPTFLLIGHIIAAAADAITVVIDCGDSGIYRCCHGIATWVLQCRHGVWTSVKQYHHSSTLSR